LANVGALESSTTTAIALRANIASPTFTGVPAVPTAGAGTRTTQIATTAYVMAQDDLRREYADTSILANVGALESSTTTAIGLRANIASPTFTGVPAAPTAGAGTRTTQIATTAYVMAQDDTQRIYTDNAITSNVSAVNNATNNNLAFKANLASPAMTGTPTAPTATAGTNTTQLATTAFVSAAITGNTALWQGSQRYINSAAPDNAIGNNGDFWFQYQ
jgi:glucose-6-phosphate 1-dehydrogenase